MPRNMSYTTCPICGRSISRNQLSTHNKIHTPGYTRYVSKYKLDHQDKICKYCGKLFETNRSTVQHEMRCRNNPDRLERHIDVFKYLSYDEKQKILESAELTAWANDRKTNKVYVRDLLEYELDDDNKLYSRWKAKQASAMGTDVDCLLSYHEYCEIVKASGIKSSDIGYLGNKYDLARYNDEGPYKIGNCRFITHKENIAERKISEKVRESCIRASRISAERAKLDPVSRSNAIKEGIRRSKLNKELD